ncbi:MAG: hypothetical protein E6108_00710 [Clostridium perfringens]|uniref:hypothetical protein n=1 Tax=Enterococcus faecalis TaxID=1351 RepID=UPI000CF2B3BC|nr:hypothetical protein [Enterococcus faecalis]MDU5411286.1 hypothetical protein [Clostridium perfringens]MDU5455684.1 hypothetical protein [Pseudescherichia vulneris]EGO9471542.1 hypothetical protein [Enterococcus faecalis]EHR4923871.1 hypothetical protein [Enterococcus faecalis]EIQ7117455.1 hypothetical protein [Enterococcus faecalis]
MNKYFLFSCQLLAPFLLLNVSVGQVHGTIKNEIVVKPNTIDNQAEFNYGDNQKKYSEKPDVQVKKETDTSEIDTKNHKKKKEHLENIDHTITIIENASCINDKDSKESILGEILFNFSGTVLYGSSLEES